MNNDIFVLFKFGGKKKQLLFPILILNIVLLKLSKFVGVKTYK